MTNPDPDPLVPTFEIRDDPRIDSMRSPSLRARSGDSTALWAVVLLLGLAIGAYAIQVARRPPPTPSSSDPAPIARTAPRVTTPRRSPPARRPSPPPAIVAPSVPIPAGTVAETPGKVVDPIEGFDSGEAFDNPPSPGRYGQRSSGLVGRTPPPPRPSTPDPSFIPR